MDQIYFWIIILFIIILILDYSDKYFIKKKEHFNTEKISDSTIPPYYEENRLYTYEPPYTTNAVNISTNKNLNFKNFGTNGITPSFLRCPACELQYDCSNYPYDVDDKNESVCTKCYQKISFDNNNFPVYAKSVGKPRVCKNLL
jgi:hypothetical protein